jgi:hypothetical protein
VYDVTEKNMKMMNTFRVFYFAWASPDLRDAYTPVLAKLLTTCPEKHVRGSMKLSTKQ